MSYEWLLVLFPVVFVLGWAAARLDIRHVRKTAGELPRAYLRGLARLLERDDEKALDAFLEVPDTALAPEEFQFAVGELSRRRGEHKRALQIHRRLYERENLPPATRHRALRELANDYYNMGFVDFAEQHAIPLLQVAGQSPRALELLLDIYQRRRQYGQALRLVEEQGAETLLLKRKMVAQWYCQFALAQDDAGEKKRRLQTALKTNPDCARASLLLAEMALAETPPDADEAARRLRDIERQNPDYLHLAADLLRRARGDAAAGEIRRWLEEYPSPMMFRAARAVLPADGMAEKFLIARGDAAAAAYWAEEQGGGGEAWMRLKDILRRHAGKAYACARCGYEVNDFSWQCRGCLEWESLKQRAR